MVCARAILDTSESLRAVGTVTPVGTSFLEVRGSTSPWGARAEAGDTRGPHQPGSCCSRDAGAARQEPVLQPRSCRQGPGKPEPSSARPRGC